MSLWGRFVRRWSGQRWFAWSAARVAPGLDRLVYRLSGGRRLATPNAIPTLLLTTTGRHSGLLRTVPLSFVTIDGADYIVGTNFGQHHQPAWALNLLSHPEATAEYQGHTWDVIARRVDEADRDDLWPVFEEIVPAYAAYRARVERTIHMFRLNRV
jgi:deazaflavin-dependent oxidoreductase (nitroreductase family)